MITILRVVSAAIKHRCFFADVEPYRSPLGRRPYRPRPRLPTQIGTLASAGQCCSPELRRVGTTRAPLHSVQGLRISCQATTRGTGCGACGQTEYWICVTASPWHIWVSGYRAGTSAVAGVREQCVLKETRPPLHHFPTTRRPQRVISMYSPCWITREERDRVGDRAHPRQLTTAQGVGRRVVHLALPGQAFRRRPTAP